jgi:hypothetical protein
MALFAEFGDAMRQQRPAPLGDFISVSLDIAPSVVRVHGPSPV